MKKYIALAFTTLFVMNVSAQNTTLTSSEIKLSKKAKRSGSYFGGGFDHQNNQTVAIFHYDGLFDVYRFSDGEQPEPAVGLDMYGLAQHLRYEPTDTDQKEDKGEKYNGQSVILVRSSFIGQDIIIERGSLHHEQKMIVQAKDMANPFSQSKAWTIDRLLYKKSEKEKIKMQMRPIGTLVYEGAYEPELLHKIQEAADGSVATGEQGIFALGKALADQVKTGISAAKAGLSAAYMQENGKAVVIGRVVEKMKIRNPDPWNNNRLMIAMVDGAEMSAEEKDIHVMPFAFVPAKTKAIQNNQKMIALLTPLNSPNTIKEAKQYQMGKEDRNRVLITIVDAKGILTDTVEYRSKGNNGKYAIHEIDDAIYIPAFVDEKHSGFYNGFVKKPSHFQITKMHKGELVFNKAYAFAEMNDKLSIAQGEKIKKIKPAEVHWQNYQAMDNGHILFFGYDKNYFYAFQIDDNGDLMHTYVTKRNSSKSIVVDSKFVEVRADHYMWMTRETPEDVGDTDIRIEESMSSSMDVFGNRSRVTTATAIPRNIHEIKAIVKVSPVNFQTGAMGKQHELGGKKYLIIGDSGYLTTNTGQMIFIGFDIKKRKKLLVFNLSLQ